MSAKHIKMWGIGRMCDVRRFVWEWRVAYDVTLPENLNKPVRTSMVFSNRRDARSYMRWAKLHQSCSNVKMERRLVGTRWEAYNDSFGWNRGNGSR